MAPEDAVRSVLPSVQSGRNALWFAAAGLAGFGGAPLLGQPGWAWPALAAGAVGAVGQGLQGRRQRERQVVSLGVIGGLSPLLGVRQLEGDTVVLRRWTRGRGSVPRRIDVRYYPGIDAGPAWRKEVLRVVAARTGRGYVVARDWPRRRRIQLRLDTSGEAVVVKPAAQQRLEKAVSELVGPTAATRQVVFEDERITGFQVTHDAAAKLAAGGYRARVERVLGTILPGRWRAFWDLEGDSARFEVRPVLPSQLWIPGEPVAGQGSLAEYASVRIPYAEDEDGQQICWRPGVIPHFLFTGRTGMGKTSTARCVIAEVTRRGWPMWIADVKRVEFRDARDWPNVQVVASSIPQIVALIHQAWRVMDQRYELVESGRARRGDFEPLFVLIDEYTEFLNSLRGWYPSVKVKGDPTVPRTVDELASILRLGRTSRVHLIITAQRPDVSLFGGAAAGEMRDNLGQRMSLGWLSPSGALMMWENAAVGVSIPRGLVGRGTTTDGEGRPVEAQAYRFPDFDAPAGSDEARLLERLRPAGVTHERLLIVDPEVPDEGPVTWWSYADTRWVLAADRPDLDPLARQDDEPVDGRLAGSTLGVLGLTGDAAPAYREGESGEMGSLIPLPTRDPVPAAGGGGDFDAAEVRDVREGGDGYGGETTSYVTQLAPGDLVCLDEEEARWAVVDMDPVEDPDAPGCWVISWRGEDDDAGVLSWPEDDPVPVRQPLEDADADAGVGVAW